MGTTKHFLRKFMIPSILVLLERMRMILGSMAQEEWMEQRDLLSWLAKYKREVITRLGEKYPVIKVYLVITSDMVVSEM